MRIAIIGSGGREHAICQKIYESRKVEKIFCIPGNGGTQKIAKNIEIDTGNFKKIKNFLIKEKIDLTVVGPEEPLVNGIVDFLSKNKLKVFGPDKFSSQLEGSKIFTKKIINKNYSQFVLAQQCLDQLITDKINPFGSSKQIMLLIFEFDLI